MPVFAYRGLAANGRSVAGVVDADSVRTARGKLRERGIFPTQLAEEEAAAQAQLARLLSVLRPAHPAAPSFPCSRAN